MMTMIIVLGTPVANWVFVSVTMLVLLAFSPILTGMVLIRERQVGIVIKRFSSRSLAPGQLIALAGEAGYQADTLAPGIHFGFWCWQYRVIRAPVVEIEQGEIALVVAAAGAAIPVNTFWRRLSGSTISGCAAVPGVRRRKRPAARHSHLGHVPDQHGAVHRNHLGGRRTARHAAVPVATKAH